MWIKRAAVGLAIGMAFLLGLVIGGSGEQPDVSQPPDDAAGKSQPDVFAREDTEASTTASPKKRAHVAPENALDAGAPVTDAKGTLTGGRVTLFSRRKYNDYERATFSFEHGIRDDPGLARTGNDWELQYDGYEDRARVRLGSGDQSTIQDLGPFTSWAAAVSSADLATAAAESAIAVEGHVYLVHTSDENSEHMSLFRVVELLPADKLTMEWLDWAPARSAGLAGLDVPVSTQGRIASFLDGARMRRIDARREAVGEIADPADILLQVRTGAQGGNHSVITMGDPDTWRLRTRNAPMSESFDVTDIPGRAALPRVFVRGGFIPAGMAFVVESADVYADAQGDSNGNGMAVAQVGSSRLARLGGGEGPISDWFEGRVILRPGDEDTVRVEVANSSAVALRLRGRFVPLAEADALEETDLWAKEAPAGTERVVADLEKVRSSYLAGPRAVLQVRADHGGGNPNRVSLLGKASIYLDKIVNEPLPPGVENLRDAVGYVEGGRIPRGQAFVITRITYRCRTTKKGSGNAFVSVMGERIAGVDRRSEPGTVESVWAGRIAVPAGSESRVFVEAAYFSEVDATFEGELIETGSE